MTRPYRLSLSLLKTLAILSDGGELQQRAVKDGGNRAVAVARAGTSTLWTYFKAKEPVHPAAQEVYSVLK